MSESTKETSDALADLEAWMSQEGIETASRQIRHMEYDPNWTGAFRVVLIAETGLQYVGEGPNKIGGLAIAIRAAIARAARAEVKP